MHHPVMVVHQSFDPHLAKSLTMKDFKSGHAKHDWRKLGVYVCPAL